MPINKEDVTFRKARNGAPITSKRGEYVCNIAKMLFAMKPGYDEYDPDRGLDLRSKLFQPHTDEERDTNYESQIMDQFGKYTDLTPTNVTAIYKDKSLVIFLAVHYQNDLYLLDIVGNRNGLEVILRDRAIPKETYTTYEYM